MIGGRGIEGSGDTVDDGHCSSPGRKNSGLRAGRLVEKPDLPPQPWEFHLRSKRSMPLPFNRDGEAFVVVW